MKKLSSPSPLQLTHSVLVMVLVLGSMAVSPVQASCAPGSGGCKDCIADQMKYGCPTCVPLLHCMARCLWGGNSKSKCISKCDCNGGKPKLSDCKQCMSRCKCSCVA